jgi:hypothetical protein
LRPWDDPPINTGLEQQTAEHEGIATGAPKHTAITRIVFNELLGRIVDLFFEMGDRLVNFYDFMYKITP